MLVFRMHFVACFTEFLNFTVQFANKKKKKRLMNEELTLTVFLRAELQLHTIISLEEFAFKHRTVNWEQRQFL